MADMRYDPSTALVVVDVQKRLRQLRRLALGDRRRGVVDAVNTQVERAVPAGASVVYTAGLAPAVHAALRQGRRHLAGPLRRADLGRRAAPAPDRRRTGRPQGRRRRGRLLGLHRAGPADRRGATTDLERLPPRARDGAGRGRRAGHRLLRPGDRPRRAPPRLRDDGPARCRGGRRTCRLATATGHWWRWRRQAPPWPRRPRADPPGPGALRRHQPGR